MLKVTWSGEVNLPLDLGKNVVDYMKDLQNKLIVAVTYAKSHTERAQTRYILPTENKFLYYLLILLPVRFTVGGEDLQKLWK